MGFDSICISLDSLSKTTTFSENHNFSIENQMNFRETIEKRWKTVNNCKKLQETVKNMQQPEIAMLGFPRLVSSVSHVVADHESCYPKVRSWEVQIVF